MKKHKVYISGQITGLPVAEYVEKFSKAEIEKLMLRWEELMTAAEALKE